MLCVITGAADGIGKALAQRFATAGYEIVGIDRDVRMAEQTRQELNGPGMNVTFIMADLSSQVDIDRALNQLISGSAIDVLVNNAGINEVGRFAKSDVSRLMNVVDVNLLAPMLLCRGLLHAEKIRSGGSLVFISSLSRFVGYPGAAVYAASKDGLASYARSLGVALAPKNIYVLTVYPGPTRTVHARRHSPDNRNENRRMLPERLADQIFRSVKARRRVLIPAFSNKGYAALGHLFPRLAELVMRKAVLDRLD